VNDIIYEFNKILGDRREILRDRIDKIKLNIINKFNICIIIKLMLRLGNEYNFDYADKIKNAEIEDIINSVFTADPNYGHMNEIENIDEALECPNCGGKQFVENQSNGIIVCECGQVIGDIFDTDSEKRKYDTDNNDMSRNAIIYNRFFPHSSMGTSMNVKGRMRKLYLWNSVAYKDRSLMEIYKQINKVCSINGIVKKIEEDTQIICHNVSRKIHPDGKNKGKPIITRGDNRKGIIAAAMFISCRRNGKTRSIKEIASYWGIFETDVNKGLKSLLNILVDDDIIKDTGTSKITDFIKRKCDELHIKNSHSELSITIAQNIEALNLASNHTTYSLAAACILLMAEINELENINKKRLSEIFGVSDVTIGKTLSQIEQYKDILIDDDKVNKIMEDIERQRKKRVIPKKVWIEMKRFNVNTEKYVLESDICDEMIIKQKLNNNCALQIDSDKCLGRHIEERDKLIVKLFDDSSFYKRDNQSNEKLDRHNRISKLISDCNFEKIDESKNINYIEILGLHEEIEIIFTLIDNHLNKMNNNVTTCSNNYQTNDLIYYL
jgi:transcription initiation factor TFIIB